METAQKLDFMKTIQDFQDSLESAKIIQMGLLPKPRHFERLFKDHFILYLPKKIVSGDFYWTGRRHNLRYLVVGDCTGHGISAALLSVLAMNLIEYSIMNKGLKKTNKILQEIDKRFIESFKNHDHNPFDNPWIDLAIICIDDFENKIYFSGGNRKILHVNGHKGSQLYAGSKYPLGAYSIENNRIYEAQIFNYNKGDIIYLGSDGFQDQFGGISNQKYSSKKLHRFLENCSHLPCQTQLSLLNNQFNEWKGNENQTDDVCIVGVRL